VRTDELKELGGWRTPRMVERYAVHSSEQLHAAAERISAAARPGKRFVRNGHTK
jgi:hypothetical protein